tara:strand:+ start:647 stop:823 length:177 start_codon:yes stop_codon:yes gene_type:complete
MAISSVEKEYYDNKYTSLKVTYNNGEIYSVPINEENRHYQEILLWVADGNTITDNGGA